MNMAYFQSNMIYLAHKFVQNDVNLNEEVSKAVIQPNKMILGAKNRPLAIQARICVYDKTDRH